MIGIIDYGMGNLHSVANACNHLGLDVLISCDPKELETCDKLILPGVGAFGDMIANLEKNNLFAWIQKQVKEKHVPLLGICLGMQALFEKSYEKGVYQGFGFLKGDVVEMTDPSVRIPEIGWNSLEFAKDHPLKSRLSETPFVYYDHSYYADGLDEDELITFSQHGPYKVPGIVGKDNVIGCQFHPEKSSKDGLAILEWFGKEFA